MSEVIERFEIRIDDSVLEDLARRLAQTRLPDQIEGAGWDYGSELSYVSGLVEYWRDKYDWRKHEAELNRLDHFQTTIDSQRIHSIHQRSKHEGAFP